MCKIYKMVRVEIVHQCTEWPLKLPTCKSWVRYLSYSYNTLSNIWAWCQWWKHMVTKALHHSKNKTLYTNFVCGYNIFFIPFKWLNMNDANNGNIHKGTNGCQLTCTKAPMDANYTVMLCCVQSFMSSSGFKLASVKCKWPQKECIFISPDHRISLNHIK